jgi:hypothetical protein
MSSVPEVNPAAVRRVVEDICTSTFFSHSERMERFLRWVVEKTLDGQGHEIREYAIGMAVFDRDSGYDPKIDTIVRVEARRLRRKLEDYYKGPGANQPLRIEVPGPGYVPVFSVQEKATAAGAGANCASAGDIR